MRKLNAKARAKLMGVAALLAPICAVQGARLMLGEGPVSASAAPMNLPPVTKPPCALVITESQRRAMEWLATRPEGAGPSRSPMEQREAERVDEPEPTTTQSDVLDPEPEISLPALKLTVVMSGAGRDVAFINDRLCSTGDEVVAGWTVVEIQPRERTVILRHDSGKTLTLMQATPKSE